MRFKIAGITYSLVFHHSLPVQVKDLENEMDTYNPRDGFGETEVILFEIKNAGTDQEERIEVDKMLAFCAPEDTYVKSIGRKIALTKMLKRRAIEWMKDKEYRKLFWKIYFSKTAELSEEIYVKYFGCPKTTYAYTGMTLRNPEE